MCEVMKLLRILALLVFPALAAIGAQSADSAPPSTASCEQIALRLRSGSEDGYRIVLGRVGIPDEAHTSGRASRNRGRLAVLSPGRARRSRRHVPGDDHRPPRVRDRVAISWGNTPPVSSLQIATCDVSVSKPWNA
jgi:hypothetical protein